MENEITAPTAGTIEELGVIGGRLDRHRRHDRRHQVVPSALHRAAPESSARRWPTSSSPRGLERHARGSVRPRRPALGVGRRDAPAALLARRRTSSTPRPPGARAPPGASWACSREVGRSGSRGGPRTGRTKARACCARWTSPSSASNPPRRPSSTRASTTDDLAFALLEPEAGVLRASDGVRALVERAQAGGLRLDQRVDAAR